MQRGFKRLAEDIAEEMRTELGLERNDPLDPFRLAEHLLIPTAPFASLREHGLSMKSIATLSAPGSPISAFTAFYGSRKAIYYNPGHSSRRTANSIAHELAHVILEHEPLPAAANDASRTWNDLQETDSAGSCSSRAAPPCADSSSASARYGGPVPCRCGIDPDSGRAAPSQIEAPNCRVVCATATVECGIPGGGRLAALSGEKQKRSGGRRPLSFGAQRRALLVRGAHPLLDGAPESPPRLATRLPVRIASARGGGVGPAGIRSGCAALPPRGRARGRRVRRPTAVPSRLCSDRHL